LTDELRLVEIREGRTQLLVPAEHESNGPSSSDMPVFYNPAMEFSRDMSVVVLGKLLSGGQSMLDGLAASGARGIRVRKEIGLDLLLHLNDGNPLATELIEKNLALNGITDAIVTRQDLRTLLLSARFDCVDIDPFGTPAPFFPMAAGAVRNRGILCVTATDTGAISGIFPSACLRKYGCRGWRTPFHHEIGVRNLLGFIAREAARQELGMKPLISYYADHYVRAFVRIERGARRADEALDHLGYCAYDPETLEREYSKECDAEDIGPIWTGQTCDVELLSAMSLQPHLRTANRIAELMELLRGEAGINRPHFTLDELSRTYKLDNPKMEELIEKLNAIGKASKTHFGPKTFATDVGIKEIIDAMK
jgi:tRNA (guanine26-N2/guanine27-N2)-dimethyltransferase